MNGLLVLIVGPSGVGKGTIISRLKEQNPDFVFPVSCTTRDPRPNEKNGEVYSFISKFEFEEGIENGDFLEYANVHGDHYYGTSKREIMDALAEGKIVVRELDIQGFQSLREVISKEQLLSIFVYVKSWDKLKDRIRKRHPESEEELERRKESFDNEMELRNLCDYEVESVEGDIESGLEKVEKLIHDKLSL